MVWRSQDFRNDQDIGLKGAASPWQEGRRYQPKGHHLAGGAFTSYKGIFKSEGAATSINALPRQTGAVPAEKSAIINQNRAIVSRKRR